MLDAALMVRLGRGVVVAIVVSCAFAHADDVTRAAQLLQPYKRAFQGALVSGLEGGTTQALSACHAQAPAIAAKAVPDVVRVGRTSHRLRNPANRSPDWVVPLLAAYVDRPEDRVPRAVKLSDDLYGYVEPIVLQPVCLQCHGKTLDAEVSAQIKMLYPEDRAVGFEVGDLRGLFWLEFTKPD